MTPKLARKPVSYAESEKMPNMIAGVKKASVSQIRELKRALDQNNNNTRVLYLTIDVAKTPNLGPNLTKRLLKFCVKVGSEYVLRLLLENQAVDLNTRRGGKLLWAAVEEGQVEIAAMLVRRGAKLSVRRSDDNSTVLHEVLRSCKIGNDAKRDELARLLLERGTDVNARDSEGYSVLHKAIKIKHCSTQLVEELLNCGAQVTTDAINNDIFWASCRKPALLPRLVEQLVPDEETRNRRGATAIHYMITKECRGAELIAATETIKRILDLGVSLDTVDLFAEEEVRDRPLLSSALSCKKKDVIKILLDCGADPREKDECGRTPLYQATSFKGYTHASRWLIEKGASIHDRNDDGCYPIHGACRNDSLRNIHLFLCLGADLNATNKKGCTPFDCMDDPFRFNEAHSLVIKHFALMIAKGKTVHDNDMAYAKLYVWGAHHFQKCAEQLEQMKVENICDDISYFSLLSKNTYSIMRFMRNPNFARKFKRDQKKRDDLFPTYTYMLLHSFEIAEEKYEVLLTETDHLHDAFEGTMPDHIVEKIAFYSCLEKFNHCLTNYYMTLHASLKNNKTDKAKIL